MNSYLSGLRAIERRQYELAVSCFGRAIELDPADADSLALRGCARLQQGDFVQASQDVEKALSLNPRLARAFYVRGALAQAENRIEQASVDLAEARALDEDGLGEEMTHWDLVYRLDLPSTNGAVHEKLAASNGHVGAAKVEDPPRPVATTKIEEVQLPVVETRDAPSTALIKLHQIEATGRASPRSVLRASLISTFVHTAALVGMGYIVSSGMAKQEDPPAQLVASFDSSSVLLGMEDTPRQAFIEQEVGLGHDEAGVPMVQAAVSVEVPLVAITGGVGSDLPTCLWETVNVGGEAPPIPELKPEPVSQLADSRSDESRKLAVSKRGGTPQSEAAVEKGLQWLVKHQNLDGSWNFDHRFCGSCGGQCSDPGAAVSARIGATAMGLLPFLGAGHTHRNDNYARRSPYRETVDRAIKYLVSRMQAGGDWDGAMTEPGGEMYDHGLAAIALCEAYGMSQDRALFSPAQRAIQFIVNAQDPKGGGWRYHPRQPGDTSVVGWQLMALKSGYLAYLKVPQETVSGVTRFLNYVQFEGGSRYGYTSPAKFSDATTAAGLLCRMYLGWKRDEPALVRGAEFLDRLGPNPNNMYFNYYATQVLHHFEGPMWERWNVKMREGLISTQATAGHAAGSWYFANERHGSRPGGRLYSTSLAIMTLEVYYRYMPLYGKGAADGKLAR